MNVDAKILNKKKKQTEFNNLSKSSYTMTKLAVSQGFDYGSTYANH
jgi:hypothetical protein